MSASDHVPNLLAQTTHGPGMHGPVLVGVVLAVAVGGLIYLVTRRRGLGRSERDPASERDPESEPDPDA